MHEATARGGVERNRETEEPMTTSTESSSTDRTDEGHLSTAPPVGAPLAWEPSSAVDAYAENELRRRHARTELMIQKAREQA